MAAHDQLELIAPNGEIKFYDLDPAKGITNIGRHPENDIVIDNPAVAAFHAVLDHRQRPYQLVVVTQDNPTSVGGQTIQPNVPHPLHSWDTIELNGHSLVLVEGGNFAAVQSKAALNAPIAGGSAGAPLVAGGRTGAPSTANIAAAAAAAATGAAVAAAGAAGASTALAPVAPSQPGSYTRLAAPPPDRVDETILTEITVREWIVDVDQVATTQITIVNAGDLVATFFARVDGVDPNWVTIEPPQVNLFEGERAMVSISITPPRRPETSAGTRFLSFGISSPDYPGHVSSLSGSLTVNPYYDYTITDLVPRQQTVGWSKQTGRASYVVANRGNSDCAYRIDGDDDERAVRFEFRVPGQSAAHLSPAELRLAPDTSVTVPILITPNKRHFFGFGKHNYMCTVTTTPLGGLQTPRAVLAQVASAPLIGPWHVILVLFLLALLFVWLFHPRIDYFGSDPQMQAVDQGAIPIKAGDTVTLYWKASPFTQLNIDSSIPQDPAQGAVPGTTGSKTFTPATDVTYVMHAQNLLTNIYQPWFSPQWSVQVQVAGILPGVTFTGTATSGTVDPQTRTITIVRGDSVTLSWSVLRTTELFLLTNDAPQTIAADQYTGSLIVAPQADTTYKLQAHNLYTGAGGFISDPIIVRVVDPTGTPLPIPVIERFDVQPLVITAGQSVALDWVVTGVQNITITGVDGQLSPTGSIQVAPTTPGTVFFKLTATNGGAPVVLQRSVTVNPAPAPTVAPVAPKIDFFTINPAQVVAGDPAASAVTLAWSVSGATSNITISGPDFGQAANLNATGTITVAVTKPTLFILTALNGPSLSSSATVNIAVLPPTPTPTPPPTATPAPTPLPVPIVSFSAISDPTHGDPSSNVVQITSSDVPSNTRKFSIVAGTWVKFSWTTTNAVKTIFDGIDKTPNDFSIEQINTSANKVFSALNAQNTQVDLFIQLVTTPRNPPPVPFNVTGVFTNPSGPSTVYWDYSSNQIYLIDYFKVYRATLPGTTFALVATNISKSNLPFNWVDPAGKCGMAYYVTAAYTDPDSTHKETGPSVNSWYSPACP